MSKQISMSEFKRIQKERAEQRSKNKEESIIQVNFDNYYSQEASRQYMSAHNLIDFLDDPATFWLKNQTDALERTVSTALIGGNIFHAFMEGQDEFSNYIRENAKAITGVKEFNRQKKTVLGIKEDMIEEDLSIKMDGEDEKTIKKEINQAVKVYEKDNLEADTSKHIARSIVNEGPDSISVLSSFSDVWDHIRAMWDKREKIWEEQPNTIREYIITEKIAGVPFKGRIDVLQVDEENKRALIYDYKTLGPKDYYGRYWNVEEERFVNKNFVQERNYDLQMWIYRYMVSQKFNIPEENVEVKLGILVKGNSKQFAKTPTNFINTKSLGDAELLAPRFSDGEQSGMTAKDIVFKYANEAYELANSKVAPDYVQNSLIYQVTQDEPAELHIDKFLL